MKAKHSQRAVPALAEILAPDRNLLTQAYKAGLILGWQHDPERGVRVTVQSAGRIRRAHVPLALSREAARRQRPLIIDLPEVAASLSVVPALSG
jgi:hypothetical protein